MRKRFGVVRGAVRPSRFYIASLGCPKNTVDSNAMGVLLQRSGYQPTLDSSQADIVIVNTCGFIEQARAESLETLEGLAASLTERQRLVAAGCWAQRDPTPLWAVPRIDAVLRTRSWPQIVPLAERLLSAVGEPAQRLIEDRLSAMPERRTHRDM